VDVWIVEYMKCDIVGRNAT